MNSFSSGRMNAYLSINVYLPFVIKVPQKIPKSVASGPMLRTIIINQESHGRKKSDIRIKATKRKSIMTNTRRNVTINTEMTNKAQA